MRHRAFTLIELLVVVSIIALLIAILLPSLKNARYTATITQCQFVLRGIAGVQLSYAIDNDGYFPAGRPRYEGGGNWFAAKSAGAQVRSWQIYKGGSNGFDLRSIYTDYMQADIDKGMECPLASDFFVKTDDEHFLSYMLYTTNNYRTKTFYFAEVGAYERMDMKWAPKADDQTQFNLLASDFVYGKYRNEGAIASHDAPNGSLGEGGNGANNTMGWRLGPEHTAPLNYANGDGSISTHKVNATSYEDTDNWLPNFHGDSGQFGFMLPRDLAQ